MWRRRAGIAAGFAAALLAAGCDTSIAPIPDRSGPLLAAVNGAPIRRLRRLSRREYNNVVRDLLGDDSRPADRFLADVHPNGYDNGSADLAVQSDQVVDYQQAAETLA